MRTVQELAVAAGKQSEARLRSAGHFLKDQGAKAVVKVADDLTDMARLGDKGLTAMKNAIPQKGLVTDGIGSTVRIPAENAQTIENATGGLTNWMKSSVGKNAGTGTGGSGVGTKGTGDVSKGASGANLKNIDDFISGTKNFEHVLDDYAKLYAERINSNEFWSWGEDILGAENLTLKQKRLIKEQAISNGYIPKITVNKVEGMRYGFADFSGAGVVEETVYLPKEFWKLSDREQFKWLDNQIGGHLEGMTWHHTETPGKMELVPYGIHQITPHNGGRTTGMWADAPR